MVTQDFQHFKLLLLPKEQVEKSLLLLILKNFQRSKKVTKYLPIHIRTSQHNRSFPDPSFYWGLKKDPLET
jgi:hypothetical protein